MIWLDHDEYREVIDAFVSGDTSSLEALAEENQRDLRALYRITQRSDYLRVVYAYYFQLRSSIGIKAPDESVDMAPFHQFRARLRKQLTWFAEAFAQRECLTGVMTLPRWYAQADEALCRHPHAPIAQLWSVADKQPAQLPDIQPRVRRGPNGPVIHVPVIVRSFLKNVALGTTNIMELLEAGQLQDESVETGFGVLFEPTLAHCLHFYGDLHPLCVPVASPVSQSSFELACRLSHAQTMFILLHEIGHLVAEQFGPAALHALSASPFAGMEAPAITTLRGDLKIVAPMPPEDCQECEVDSFALHALLQMGIADADEVRFAVLTLMDLMLMVRATHLRCNGQFLPPDPPSPHIGLANQLHSFTKGEGARKLVLRACCAPQWTHPGYQAAAVLFERVSDRYIDWVQGVQDSVISSIVERRRYGY